VTGQVVTTPAAHWVIPVAGQVVAALLIGHTVVCTELGQMVVITGQLVANCGHWVPNAGQDVTARGQPVATCGKTVVMFAHWLPLVHNVTKFGQAVAWVTGHWVTTVGHWVAIS